MARIFISYRRQDSPSMTGRIYDQLEHAFGSDRVFRDLDDIGAGQDFRAKIAQEIGKSDVLLVIIGPKWESITDSQGKRRLDNPNDFVRLEVEEGLKNPKKIVIPVLVENTLMPSPESLPKSLRELCYRNAVNIRQDPDFHPDMQKLISQIRKIGKVGAPVAKKTPVLIGVGVLALCLVAVLIAGSFYLKATPKPVTITPTLSPTSTETPTPTSIATLTITETVTETSQPPVSGTVRIGVLQIPNSIFKDTVKRLDNLGFEAEWLDISAGDGEFSKYDVVYLPIGWSSQNGLLESKASAYQRFVNEGGGLVVEQPNVRSAFTSKVLPYEVIFNVFKYSAEEVPPRLLADHEITRNIRPSEFPGPGDKLGSKDRRWQILTSSAKTNYATLMVAEYGEGRIVVLASGISKNREVQYQLGDHFIKRLIEWVSSISAP